MHLQSGEKGQLRFQHTGHKTETLLLLVVFHSVICGRARFSQSTSTSVFVRVDCSGTEASAAGGHMLTAVRTCRVRPVQNKKAGRK